MGKYGSKLDFFIQLSEESGELHTVLQSRPALQAFDTEVWNAFSRLSSRRPVSGMGSVGAIPIVEIVTYVDEVLRIQDLEDRQEFIELLEYLDGEALAEIYEKMDRDRKAAESKSKAKAPAKNPRPSRR